MTLKYDQQADAIYIYLGTKPYAYGTDLDDERRIDYAADNTPIGVELLCVSKSVNLDSLPCINEIAEILEVEGIKIYVMERRPSAAWQGYSNVEFNVKLTSPAAEEVGELRIKEEVTA